ncbi:MAG: RtcB family protein, partial [Myxococcota bacterium]
WLMVHSGSRAMGQSITAHHLAQADRSTRLPSLVADSDAGRAYLSDQRWARAYARENRHRIAKAAVGALREVTGEKSEWAEFFDGDHNHVQREVHAGEALFVHRKGAQSAREGERGIIPGSMGSPSFHVEGRGEASSFCSSSHGAGRALSRTEARRRVSPLGFLQDVEGVWFNPRLASRLREEAPRAYKDIGKVMRAQRDLVRIVRRLRPRLSFKGV